MKPRIDIMTEGVEPSPAFLAAVRRFMERVVADQGKENWELSLTLCGNTHISRLNEEYRGKKGPTDVLTFVMDEGEDFFPSPGEGYYAVGDIVLSLEQVELNSGDWDVSFEEELKRVMIHGILHLKGLTHEEYDWKKGMLMKQEKLLKKYEEIRIMENNETFLEK